MLPMGSRGFLNEFDFKKFFIQGWDEVRVTAAPFSLFRPCFFYNRFLENSAHISLPVYCSQPPLHVDLVLVFGLSIRIEQSDGALLFWRDNTLL